MSSPGELGPISLRFRDRALEAEYREKLAPQIRRRHAIVWGGIIAVSLGMAAIDGVVVGPDHLRTIWAIRYGLILPFLALVGAFGFVPLRVYATWSEAINSLGCAGGLAFVGAIGMAISPMPFVTAQYGIVVTAISALFVHTVGMAGFLWNCSAALLGSSVVVVALRVGELTWDQTLFGAFFIGVGNVVGATLGYALERYRRREFHQQRTIAEERARSEALRLRADVAERSRQLAEALLRLSAAPGAPVTLAPGDLVDDRYRVLRLLGKGGMGAVYEVVRTRDGQAFALKVLTGGADREALARFAREAQIAAEIDHPNVVTAVDFGVTLPGTLFFVMELVTGTTLAAERARYGDVGWALLILRQVAAALAAMHARGVVHRDLKPANVLLRGDLAKVADFGIASLAAPSPPPSESAGDSTISVGGGGLTRTGALMGTPMYMAPELVHGVRDAKPSADVWSFGVMACEMLTGRPPFAEPPVFGRRTLRAVPDRGLPPPLRALIDGCLDEDVGARPTAAELVGLTAP